MVSRRRVLAACASGVGTVVAGCTSGSSAGGAPATPTATCSATDPPAPTDAATSARSYPERPTELTADSVESFVSTYERAYQYNDALAANPDKIGHTNEFTVHVGSVSVTSEGGGFTAVVSGQLQSDIIDSTPTTDPETPTETPLPMGRGPFEAAYAVTPRELRREDVVVECW